MLHFKKLVMQREDADMKPPNILPHMHFRNTRLSVSIEHSVAAPGCVVVAGAVFA